DALCVLVFFFFFQAEDGIRDLYVTGVQTCALPISKRGDPGFGPGMAGLLFGAAVAAEQVARNVACRHAHQSRDGDEDVGEVLTRSEERRVGKECRCRWER